MGDFLIEFKRFFRKGDMVLLALCLTATVFGLLVIASATNAVNSTRYIILQGFSAVIGVLFTPSCPPLTWIPFRSIGRRW